MQRRIVDPITGIKLTPAEAMMLGTFYKILGTSLQIIAMFSPIAIMRLLWWWWFW